MNPMRSKSDENWIVGNACLGQGHVNVAANRLYYAVFQVVYEYAQKYRQYDKDRRGVHADMAKVVDDVIKDKRHRGRLYRKLKSLRETADYDAEDASAGDVNSLLTQAERIRDIFIDKNNGAK